MNAALKPPLSSELPERLAGRAAAVAPTITPLDDELGIAHGACVAHAQRLLDDGCHGIAVFGTTGEANSFSVDERVALLDALLEAGIPVERLMVGTGTCALSDTVRLTAHAAASGVKKVLMLPPFYYKGMSDRGLFDSFSAVFERVADSDLRVFLYHFPKLSGVPVTPGLIEKLLAAYPEIVVGIKDSSGDWTSTEMLCTEFPSLAVFPGNEKLMLAALRRGGVGTITAGANANAAAIRAAFDSWAGDEGATDAGDADAAQQAVTDVRTALDSQPMVPGLKWLAGRHAGNAGLGRVRPPMVALDDDAGAELLAALARAGWQDPSV